jgi:hypothetical protein
MLLARSRDWQNDADGERGGNEKSGGHTSAEPRTRMVNVASFIPEA